MQGLGFNPWCVLIYVAKPYGPCTKHIEKRKALLLLFLWQPMLYELASQNTACISRKKKIKILSQYIHDRRKSFPSGLYCVTESMDIGTVKVKDKTIFS